MFYVELLRTRNAVMWTAFGLCVLSLGTVILGAIFPGMRYEPSQQPLALMVVGWIASLVAAVLASMLGTSLATENCSHLEIAWTRPISRTARALGMYGIDLAALVVIFGMTFAATYLVASFLGDHLIPVTLDQPTLGKIARFAIFPVAWFGMAQGLTGGTHGKTAGWIVGLSWPVAEGLSLLGTAALAAPLQAAVTFLNYANPLTYYPFWTFDESIHHGLRAYFGLGVTIDSLALASIAIIGLVIATMSWRRLEA